MVERPKEKNKAISLPQDSSQLPLASRLILYVIKMLTSGTADVADPQLRSTLFLYLPLAVQLIEDDMSMEGSTGILPLDAFNARGDFVELVSRSRHYINQWIYSSKTGLSSDDDAPTDALNFWQNQLEHVQGNNPKTFRLAEVYTKVMSERDSLGKVGFAESSFELAQKLNVPSNPFVMVAVITAFRTSLGNTPVITTLCNQMVAQATGLDEFGEVEGRYPIIYPLCELSAYSFRSSKTCNSQCNNAR